MAFDRRSRFTASVRQNAVLFLCLCFIGFFAFLTAYVVLKSGVDILVIISVVIIMLFVVGVIGALRQPPPT